MEQEQMSHQVPGSLWEAFGAKKDDEAKKEKDGMEAAKMGAKDDA